MGIFKLNMLAVVIIGLPGYAVTAAVISNFAVLHWYVAIIVAIVSVLIGVASTVFPAIFATRAKPSKALRSI